MLNRTLRPVLLILLAAFAAPAPVSAQPWASSASATCAGGAVGCQQVNFFLNLNGLTGETWLDYFPGPSTTTPEPISLGLMATGLVAAPHRQGQL
jgi:hypothetical protein